jgi:hypothetical protein
MPSRRTSHTGHRASQRQRLGPQPTDTRYNVFAVNSSATGGTQWFGQRGNPFQMGVDVRMHF